MDCAAIEMRHITKRFAGVLANDRVDFDLRAGEIHALLGENGAGKTTLMNILCGLYKSDDGEIFIRGKKVLFNSPRDAINAGIGMVHQHFRLVSPFTVTENIILGLNDSGLILRMDRAEKEIEDFSRRYGLDVDARAKVWQLSIGEQQRVEIIKALYQGADALILDEPTAVLTPQEAGRLFDVLRQIARGGKSVVIITHKLNEVMNVADRITVLRNGRSVATVTRAGTSITDLTGLMVDRELTDIRNDEEIAHGEVVLELENVHSRNDKGYPALRGVSLALRAGEILGIAGVAGNGQRELAEVINGLRAVESGEISVSGKKITNCPARDIIDTGVAFIPEDRMGMGLIPNLSVTDNIILKSYRKPSLLKGLCINWPLVKEKAEFLVKKFGIQTVGVNSPIRTMSGGHLQRLLLSREVDSAPRLIVAVYPTRGLDISATGFVHQIILEQRAAGVAILLISEDLEEIFKLSDRIAVLYEGRIMGILPARTADVNQVGMMMAGIGGGENC